MTKDMIAPSAKKLWGVEDGSKQDETKAIFLGSQWREAPWSSAQVSEHAISQPILVQRRSGSYPGGDVNSVLSPRSSEAGGLGMKMVEYVLGSSPPAKDLDARMARLGLNSGDVDDKGRKDQTSSPYDNCKVKDHIQDGNSSTVVQSNGIVQNGLDDDKGFNRTPGSRQPSPSEEDHLSGKNNAGMVDLTKISKADDMMVNHHHHHQQQQQQQQQHHHHQVTLSHHQQQHLVGSQNSFDQQHLVEPVAIDPVPFDYPSQLMQSMDSPNILDYNNQLYQRQQAVAAAHHHQQQQQQQQQQQHHQQQAAGPSMTLLAQQQYLAAQQQQQQLGMAQPSPYPSNSYIINAQDPYAAVGPMMPGPPMMQQYYGMTPWGMYPANIIQQQQQQQQQQGGPGPQGGQQMMRGNPGRPMTPQQGASDGLNGLPQGVQAPGSQQYPVLAPAFYDQNGSLVMGSSRGLSTTPMRLVSPSPVIVNPNGNLSNNTLRLLGSQAQHMQNAAGPPASLYSSNGATAGQNSLYNTPPSTSGLGFPPSTSGMGFNHVPQQNNGGLGYGSNGSNGSSSLGSIGSSSVGPLGNVGLSSGAQQQQQQQQQQRRDSFDRRGGTGGGGVESGFQGLDPFNQRSMPKGPQYYGALGTVTASPGSISAILPGLPAASMGGGSQSLTPPPQPPPSSLSNNFSLGAFMSGNRIISAAPGAEAKFRNGTSMAANGLFGSVNLLYPNRSLQRNSSVEKTPNGRSRLLEDFRNNRFPNLQLRDLSNHIVEFSQDQHGSRFIQQKLERATPPEKQMVFGEILMAAYGLMTDVFGNYVIQKFFEFGTTEQKQTLAQKVRGHVLPLALQMYGCRVIQKALESIPPDQQKDVVRELDGHVLKCVKDQNGNHVVQKCIECVDPMALQFVINAFQGQVFSLSTHPYGCRVIQRILEHCTGDQTTPILEELHGHTEQLVQDQYGNYVIQHVLEHGRPDDKSKIVSVIRGKVLQLSQHKFASNVVEKCVTHATRGERAMLIDEVCAYNDGALYTMMKDQFANYVVQKMIDVAEPSQRKMLMHKIRPHVATLRKYTYGKHILAKLEKHFMKGGGGGNSDLIGGGGNGGGPNGPSNGSL